MNDMIICIGRQYGSGGREVGEKLAKRLGVSRQTVNDIVREKRGLSPEMCLRLGRLFGTTPQFWMNMQSKVDIWDSLALHEDEVMAIEPIEIVAIA